MATKTISIDLEAYSRLKKAQLKGESFSQVIKRMIKPPLDIEAWLKKVANIPMDEAAAEVIEQQIQSRRKRLKRAS